MTEESKKETVNPTSSSKDIEENKVMAAIGYLGILFLVPLLAKKDSPYAQYHARQGLALCVAGIIIGMASALPIIGWFLIAPIGSICLVIFFVMGLINAFGGKMKPLPLIGKYAENVKI